MKLKQCSVFPLPGVKNTLVTDQEGLWFKVKEKNLEFLPAEHSVQLWGFIPCVWHQRSLSHC